MFGAIIVRGHLEIHLLLHPLRSPVSVMPDYDAIPSPPNRPVVKTKFTTSRNYLHHRAEFQPSIPPIRKVAADGWYSSDSGLHVGPAQRVNIGNLFRPVIYSSINTFGAPYRWGYFQALILPSE